MKHLIIISLIFISGIYGSAIAQEKGQDKNGVKSEIQELREKITEMNNRVTIGETSGWGNNFSIGLPVGLFNEDMIISLDFQYSFTPNLVLRIEAQFLWDRFGPINEIHQFNNVIAMPYIGLLGKSSMLLNTRIYGGFFVGIAYGLISHPVPYPLFTFKGLGGVEIFANKNQAFFIEIGGGGVVGAPSTVVMTYSNGAFFAGGTRFYF